MLISVNPATEEQIESYQEHTPKDVQDIIEHAQQAFILWKQTDLKYRSVLMRAAARVLREHKDRYARVMTLEMGKPVTASVAEVEKCAWVCDYYAEHAATFLAQETVATDASESFIAYQPLGIILGVMPWNFPFWQVFRFAAPSLMAGNAGILKHASNVTGCALAIEEVFRTAGFPEHLFRVLKIGSPMVADVIEHPHVQAVTLTGSGPAGKAVAQKAGSMLKKTVLELGGGDPYIILSDANLDEAVPVCVHSRLINNGQSCIAAKRFIVTKNNLDEFTKRFTELMATFRLGDPMNPQTRVGPQARIDLRDELHQQVTESIRLGAHCVLGGQVPDLKGAWYAPTVLTRVIKGMPAYDDELFGPVAAIIAAEDDEEAITIANDSDFGLGAALFTRDIHKGKRLAEEYLEAGSCFVNESVKSDPRLPFGGIKQSGYGRELSYIGIREFVNIKTVYIK